MTELIVTATAVVAVAGAGAAWYFRRKAGQARRRGEQLREHADRLTLQLVAAEQCVGHLAATVIPAAAKGGPGGSGPGGGLLVPAQLDGTPLVERLRDVPGAVASAVGDVRAEERASRRPSGLRKTMDLANSLAHRTTWLRSDFPMHVPDLMGSGRVEARP
ncbi:hypothetical protein GCM10023177_36280 [Streptomyces violaceoruber]